MRHAKCLAMIFYLMLITIHLSRGDLSASSPSHDDINRNSTSLQMKRGVKRLLRLQFIRNRIHSQLRMNRTLDKDEMADSSSFTSFLPSSDNLQFDTISDSDKFNQIIPIVNLTSSVSVSHDGRNNYSVVARCLRGIGKVDNISSLLSRSDRASEEFHLYFPPSPHFRPKGSHDTNSTIKKVLLKLHRKHASQLESSKCLVSVYRVPVISLGRSSQREPAVLLDTQNVNDGQSGWFSFDLSHFYLSSHFYDKLVNSLILVNATDTKDNAVNMATIFTPPDCELDPSEDADALHQPTLELKAHLEIN